MSQQRTISSEVKLAGKGLFSGGEVKMTFKPASVGSGVVFVRTDLDQPVRIAADVKNITPRGRRSALVKGSVSVETTEHCLAAVSALGIDNLTIEMTNAELPGFDGSSSEFFKALKKAGILEQDAPKKVIKISKPISIIEGDSSIYALPSDAEGLSITFDMDYTAHTGIGRQIYTSQFTTENFERNISTARTFLLEAEAKQFQSRGIGAHLSPKDILVISSDGPIKNSYRFEDECVRHKIADLIGDLKLAGADVTGRIVAYKSGHSLNHKLAEKLQEMEAQQARVKKTGSAALMDIKRIQRILPHRYPFLLVDRVIEIVPDKRIVGIKNVTFNEHFFQGHFPQTPIMPGVLIVEAMAQVSGLLFSQTLENTGKLAVLVSMDGVKIRRSVVPGDQIKLISEVVKVRKRTGQCKCSAQVDGDLVAEADIKFMLVDDENV